MKTIMKKNRIAKIIGVFIFTAIVGFTIYQSVLVQKEKQLIIGTWGIDNEPGNKWIFTSNQCKWELDGVTLYTFTYSISNDFSPSGLEHTYVKLINVNDPNDIVEFAINSLGDDKMTLETLPPKIDYTHFTKE